MDIELFNKNVKSILDKEQVENYKLINIDLEEEIIFNKNNNKKIFNDFINYYKNIYENDLSNLFMKTQDFVYQLNLIINELINIGYSDKRIVNESYNLIKENNIDIFEACDYSEYDLKRISDEMEFCKKEI